MLQKILFLLLLIINTTLFSLESFKGYASENSNNNYSVLSLMESKYIDNPKWNENYFHDAQFPDKGITIFTDIIFSNSFFDKRGCKFHCIITFKDQAKYTFNKDYSYEEYSTSKSKFLIKFGNNKIELNDKNYSIHIEDENINLSLNYEINYPPHIFGDGIINVDSKNFLASSQPIAGATVSGNLFYKEENIKLNGKGSVNHDYSVIAPLKTPLKWRSFWLYNDSYTILINTIILKDGTQIDRVVFYKDGKLLRSFLNSGLITENFKIDKENNFNYPTKFSMNHTSENGDKIIAEINFKEFTDKIQTFSNLSSVLHSIVSIAVGEMWVYRFWSGAIFKLKIDDTEKTIKISGIGNYVDVAK